MSALLDAPASVATRAEKLVREARCRGGLAPLDLERFWEDQALALSDPFGAKIPQVPIGNLVTHECIFDELGLKEDWHRLAHDPVWVAQASRAYNDKAEPIIGRRPLNEKIPDLTRCYPPHRQLHDFFEAKNIWHMQSYWLHSAARNEKELAALLDRVDARLDGDVRSFVLPETWDEEKARLIALGVRQPLYRAQRGPVTFATSVYGVQELIYLYYDNEDLFVRFSRTILRAMLALAEVLDREAGYTRETAPHGFSFLDDNCALFTPPMYELFGAPVLRGIWERYSPNPCDRRYQHSDSAMAHILPSLSRLRLTGTNFGPTVRVDEIRRHLPNAVIEGELAPFTYSRNEEVNMVAEFLRDYELIGDTRGLIFTTAGSVNNGSRLTGMRLIMAAVQRYGRYNS